MTSSYPAGMPESLKRCEECGEPTTVVISDLEEVEAAVTGTGTWRRWRTREKHSYCGTHARCSLHYLLDGTVQESCCEQADGGAAGVAT